VGWELASAICFGVGSGAAIIPAGYAMLDGEVIDCIQGERRRLASPVGSFLWLPLRLAVHLAGWHRLAPEDGEGLFPQKKEDFVAGND
jgi:hypothetical protein